MTDPDPAALAHVEELAENVRRRRSKNAVLLPRLLERWKNGDEEERRAVEGALEALARPNRIALWVAIPLGLVAASLGYDAWKASEARTAMERGPRTLARIEQLSEGFCWLGSENEECVELELALLPRAGAPRTVTLTAKVPERYLARVQAGSYIEVVVDDEDSSSVLFDVGSLGAPAPRPPLE